MTAQSSGCIDPEVIAAFVAGSLTGAELSTATQHLQVCEDCREMAAEAARIDREGVPAESPPRPYLVRPWWIAAAAAAIAIVFFAYHRLSPSHRRERAFARLIAASPHDARYVEPRLTGGFPWAPVESRRGEATLDAEHMTLIGAAGAVLHETENDSRPEARHAAAIAHLLAGDAKKASDVLAEAASSAADARVWSDLAAARYTESVETGDPAQLTQALAAADAALRIDGRLAEALFNRALIVERLGLRDQARAAWERYLSVDDSSKWSDEARRHLLQLAPVADFRPELQRRYSVLQRDPAAARELADRYPHDARLWGETEILGRWADAFEKGDVAIADRHLAVARAFGESVARRGDMMLARAVEAIERADTAQRKQLASGHRCFREGQRLLRAGQPADAEPLFVSAQRDLASGGSPAALLASYFGANTLYLNGHIAQSRALLARLALQAPPEYPAHRAQVEWQLGLADASVGAWGDAIRALSDSIATFDRLSDSVFANRVRDILAEVYDRLGERRIAWRHRIIALRGMGRSDPQRLRVALYAAARSSALNRQWAVTASLLGLQLELPSDGDDLLNAEVLLHRARIRARMGDREAASLDLRAAIIAIGRIADRTFRAQAEADRLAVEALLEPDPARVVPALSRAIDFHRLRGRPMFVPELLLERGRALATTGKVHEAAADFERGIHEIELQNQSVSNAEGGWGTFAIAEELLEEAIGMAVKRGDAYAAFRYMERWHVQEERSRERSEGGTTAGMAVVEYATLTDRVIIFVVEGDRLRLIESEVGRTRIADNIDEMTQAAMTSNTERFRRASSALYDELVAPIASAVSAAPTLAFVPDVALRRVPFAALLDPSGKYVIEKHVVVTAPSHAWCVRLSALRSAGSRTPLQLLLMQGPAVAAGESLWSMRREADSVASQYGAGAVVQRSERTDFEKYAANADIIHFVGHAVMPDQTAEAALVTSGQSGAAGALDAGDIATMCLVHPRAVVLAACGTARDFREPGETSISIARAFLAAGVPSVVATLWPIDDEAAAEFFPRLHAHLARGEPAAKALRATQLEWIHRPDAAPAMWAAVQLIGV